MGFYGTPAKWPLVTQLLDLGRTALPLVEVNRVAFQTGRSDPHKRQ